MVPFCQDLDIDDRLLARGDFTASLLSTNLGQLGGGLTNHHADEFVAQGVAIMTP